MQIDEVCYAEDLKPLGLNWIKLGFQDVLYNPETKEFFTPSTGKSANIDSKILQSGLQDDTLEARAQPRDKNGRFATSGASRGSKTKYAPTMCGKNKGITVSPKKYGKLCGTFNTNFPELTAKDGARCIYDSKYRYKAMSDGNGGIIIDKKIKIK